MNPLAEWLEADGLGGFASGTVSGTRTRRYHALLLSAATPPTDRYVLVNGFDAWIETPSAKIDLSSQRYAPDATFPDGSRRIERFDRDPWPRWTFRLEDGTRVEQELWVPIGSPTVVLRWRLVDAVAPARLHVRPFLSGRDYHSLHHENPAFRAEPERSDGRLVWRPYPGVPPIVAVTRAEYRHDPRWYWNFQYDEERARGLDFKEDLLSPGIFIWDLPGDPATLVLTSDEGSTPDAEALRESERVRRATFASPLRRAADAYLVRRGGGKTIVAGYPWFGDWGRDTFIAMRGLCLALGRRAEAGEILLAWARMVDQGMLPNRFPDQGGAPEYNSVDASLWFVAAASEFLKGDAVGAGVRAELEEAIQSILAGYSRGTRYGIRADDDGLLRAGEPGVQLTWMDARVGDRVVTPRIGKPVEVQALWLYALFEGGSAWWPLMERGIASFRQRFWNEAGGYLYDVIDADHERGKVDATFRPNQIFAAGGLPIKLIEDDRAGRVLDEVERRLWTPAGLRSLAPEDPAYRGHYEGGPAERDAAYHQGTVWPWLAGPFIEAWIRLRGGTDSAKHEAARRFVEPLLARLDLAGLGHLSEIADGDAPHDPRGCPFQAWSLGELICILALAAPNRL